MTVGEKIAIIRYQRGISLVELSKITGLPLGLLSNIESGYIEPSEEVVKMVCRGLDFGTNDLMQNEMMLAKPGATQIPIYTDMEDLISPASIVKPKGSVYISNMLLDKGEHFIVKVSDSAMDATRIQAEDYVLVKRQPFIRDHDVAVVQIGEKRPIIRSVVEREHETVLFAKNFTGTYPPIMISSTDYFRIIGKVVRVIANLRQYNTCMKLMQSDGIVVTEDMLETYGIYKPISIADFKFEK